MMKDKDNINGYNIEDLILLANELKSKNISIPDVSEIYIKGFRDGRDYVLNLINNKKNGV